MNKIEVDLSPIGANFKLRLISNSILPLSRYNLISLIDFQHLPPFLISKDNFKLNLNNESIDQKEINDNLEFIEILFKSCFSTNKIIALLLNTENSNIFGIIYPDIITSNKYSIKLNYIDLNDNFISKFLINNNNNDKNNNNILANQDSLDNESQSLLAKSLNAHIIRRKFKTSNNSSSSPTSSITSSTTISSINNNNNNLKIEPSIIFTSDNFITSIERLIKGEFRMRRLNSKFDSITLRKLEKLLIRSIIFKFRNRSGMQFLKEKKNSIDDNDNNGGNNAYYNKSISTNIIKISVSEIQDTLESLIPVLL